MQSKIKKRMLGTIIIFGTTLLCTTLSTTNVKAANITNVDEKMNKITSMYFDKYMKNEQPSGYTGIYYKFYHYPSTTMDPLDLKAKSKNIRYSNLNPEFIGENTFDNKDMKIDQNYNTTSFSHQKTNTVSNSITKGFSIGGKLTTIKLPIPLINNIELNATINTSSTQTTTDTETKTITVPSQPVRVPAGKIYKTIVYMEKKSFTADVDFYATTQNVQSKFRAYAWVNGPFMNRPSKYIWQNLNTKDMWNKLSSSEKNQVKEVSFEQNGKLTLNGTSQVTGIYGTNFYVKTYDVTPIKNKSNHIQAKNQLVDTQVVSAIN